MVSMKPKISIKTIVLPIIGIFAFLIYLYLFRVNIPEVIETIRNINLNFYLLAIIFIFIETFLYTLSWQSLLNFLSIKLPIFKLYLYVWYGTFIDIIVPAESISGEVSKLYLVTREEPGCGGKVVATLVTQRLISMGTIISSLILGLTILSLERQTNELLFQLSLFFTFATFLILVLLIFLAFNIKWTLKIINVIIRIANFIFRERLNLKRIKAEAIKAAKIFHVSMKEFRNSPMTILTSTFFLVLSWISSLVIAYSVFLALNFNVQWGIILVTLSLVLAIKAIPLGVPFEIGLPEIAMTTIYTLLGVPANLAATATILTRILTVWLRFFIGFVAQQSLEVKNIAKTIFDSNKS